MKNYITLMPQLFYTIGSYEIIQEDIQNLKNKITPYYNQIDRVTLPATRYTIKPKSRISLYEYIKGLEL